MTRTIVSAPVREVAEWPRYRLREGVLLVVAQDGSARLLDLSGEACALSTSAAMMLEGVLNRDVESACRDLAAAFASDARRIRPDLDDFLSQLQRRGLVVPPGRAARGMRSISAAMCWLCMPVLAACTWAPRRFIAAKAWVLLSLAFVSTRLFGWPHTVRVWCRASSGRRRAATPTDDKILDAIDTAVMRAISSHLLQVSCKERALCCQLLARAAGEDSRVVLGIDLLPFAMHCWCESRARVLADRYDGHCDRFTPIMVYA